MPGADNKCEPGAEAPLPAGSGQNAQARWERKLLKCLGSRCVVLGMGNRDRGDDGAGCAVAEALARRLEQQVPAAGGVLWAADCAGVPENYLSRVERLRPSDVVLVDAVDFGSPPGSVELFGPCRPAEVAGDFGFQSASTHSPGLHPVLEFLTKGCSASCWVLGVQPASLAGGQGLSEPVRRAVERIVSCALWAELARRG